MGLSESIFAPTVYLFAELIFIGMVELSSQLSDPFGQDEVDFPINDWLSLFIGSASVFIEQEYWGSRERWATALQSEQMLRPSKLQVDLFIDEEHQRAID